MLHNEEKENKHLSFNYTPTYIVMYNVCSFRVQTKNIRSIVFCAKRAIYMYIITHRKRHETQHINVNYRLKFRKTQ